MVATVQLRRARPEDAPELGRICYEAFKDIATRHGFPPDIPNAEVSTGMIAWLIGDARFYALAAEVDGRLAGSNFLDERDPVRGLGPITVDPELQNSGVGRQLMLAALERATEQSAPAVRLVQSGYHTRSLSLYTKLGFQTRVPLACLSGPAFTAVVPGYDVRTAEPADLEACHAVCRSVHGHDRSNELADGIARGSALVAEHAGHVAGYCSALGFLGHAVATSNEAMQALIGSGRSIEGPGMLIPATNAPLFAWCLEHGLRTTQIMNLMTLGLYNEPAGAYVASILY